MPGLDKTGPDGQGSKTGIGLGGCNPDSKEKLATDRTRNPDLASRLKLASGRNAGWFIGQGRGRGSGRNKKRKYGGLSN